MTDNEIIKALESCKQADKCAVCPLRHEKTCLEQLSTTTLDLINRQKAEIEELKREIGIGTIYKDILIHTKTLDDYNAFKNAVKTEAIREFAERLKNIGGQYGAYDSVFERFIDNLVKEMTEGENGDNS